MCSQVAGRGSGFRISRMDLTSASSFLLSLAVLAMGFAAGQLCRNNVTTFVFESFDCFKDRHLKCTGDCISTADGKLNLTRYDTRSWGRLMYAPGIRLMDPATTRVAFFSTNFTFSMKGDYSKPGEGLAFVMQANPSYQGHGGGFLGLYDKDGKAETQTVAVEFDTYREWFYGFFMFNDMNSNHVGVDIESIKSKVQVDAGSVGIDLGKEHSVTAWIDYIPASESFDGDLQVRISIDNIRPALPLISYSVDLSKHIAETMYLGFSATTGDHVVTSDCLSYHNILSWSFQSWGLDPDSPPPAPAPAPPPPSVLPPVPLPPEPPTPPFPPSPARPPLTPDAPSPSPSGSSPPVPAPFSPPSPSPSPSETPTLSPPSPSLSPPAPNPVFPPVPATPPAPPPNSPVPLPSPDTPTPSIPDVPASSPSGSLPPAISPSSPSPGNEPSLAPESVPTPSAGPSPSSYVSPPATLPPAPASTPTPSPVPSPSTPSRNSTVSPSSDPPSPTPAPTSVPAPEPSPSTQSPAPAPAPSTSPEPAPASTPTPYPVPSPFTPSPNSTVSPSSEPPSPTSAPTSLPAPAPSTASSPEPPIPGSGQLDATRPTAASIAGFALLFGGYVMVVYNRVISELGHGRHSHRRLGYLGDQTVIEIWPTVR